MLLIAGRGFGQGFWKNNGAAPGGIVIQMAALPDGKLLGYLYSYSYLNDFKAFVSSDSGRTWTTNRSKLLTPPNMSNGVFDIQIGRTGTLYATNFIKDVTYDSSYFTEKSTDFGLTWSYFLDNSDIAELAEAVDGKFFALKVNSPGLLSEFVTSVDSCKTWTENVPGVPFFQSSDHVVVDDYGHISCDIWISIDSGTTWRQKQSWDVPIVFPSGIYVATHFNSYYIGRGTLGSFDYKEIKLDPSAPYLVNKQLLQLHDGSLIVFCEDIFTKQKRAFTSVDEGLTWQETGLRNPSSVTNQKPMPDGGILSANFRISRDTLKTWDFTGKGIRADEFKKVMRGSRTGELFGMTQDGLWKSENDAADWNLIAEHLPGHDDFDVFYDFNLDQNFNPIVLTDSAIYYSTNGGADFLDISPQDFPAGSMNNNSYWPSGIEPTFQFDSISSSIFIRHNHGTYKSGDFGASWHEVLQYRVMYHLYAHPSGKLLASFEGVNPGNSANGERSANIWYSDDAGETWDIVKSNNEPIGVFDEITVDKVGKIYVSSSVGGQFPPFHYFTSVDTGTTWVEHNPPMHLRSFCFNSANHIIATDSTSIFRSVDGGDNWTKLPPHFSGKTYWPIVNMFVDSLDRLYFWMKDIDYEQDSSFFRSNGAVLDGSTISGTLYKSNDNLCQTTDPQLVLANWIIKAAGEEDWFATTNADGDYVFFVDTGSYQLIVEPPIGPLWGGCTDSSLVYLPKTDTTIIRDLQETALADCPYMTVDAWAWLQRCFDSDMFFNYCNVGTLPTDSAWLEIELDPYLTLTDSVHNWLPLGQNRFKTFLGALDIGECGSLTARVFTDCDSTVLGQVHCIEAHVTPDNLCIIDSLWSGAEIMARAICEGDSVRFEVGNPTNVATQPLEYVIIEDDVILFESNATYPANSVTNFTVEAGGFLRFESEQEPNHPFSTMVAAWQAGCDTMGGWTWINQFFTDNGFPSRDVACVANVGSYDPNDKLATPLGFGAEHFILPESDLEYVVNFQNTGTAAAQNVVIRDTISGFLDPATIRMGASSHPMTWSLDGHGTLKVSFENINLPDSNANEAASHGFFSFKISQKPGLPLGTLIENQAAIYFDFNEPIITNTTFNRLQLDFLKTKDVAPAPGSRPSVKIRPNPITDYSLLEFENLPLGQRQFTLTNTLGATMQSEFFSGQKFHFERRELPAGAYFFSVSTEKDGRVLGGKMILR